MSEIDAMKTIEERLEPLEESARKRVLDWACARFLGAQAAVGVHQKGQSHKSEEAGPKPKKAKGKSVLKQIKDLNLSPAGKKSGSAFALEKKPTNVKEKCVVAVYYLRDELNIAEVSVDHVYTFFKHASWPVPSDLPNTLQQAGTAGWLDTANSQNIIITSNGENLVEHSLPKKAAK